MNISGSEVLNASLGANQTDYDESSEYYIFDFVISVILLNVVGVLGIFGNVVSMVILSRPQMRSSINYLLVGLARCDTVLIITSILLFGLPAVNTQTGQLATYVDHVYPQVAPLVFPLAMIAQTVSVYLTLTVTLERFVAVCHPLQARSLCTYGRARLYVIVIIVFSTIYNLPRFLEADRVEEFHPIDNITMYVIRASELRNNEVYISVYIHWLYLFFIYFVPFTCMAVLNAAIYRQVRLANQARARLTRLQKKEIGLATMLLFVVVVFFLCNLLALVNNILEAFYGIVNDQLVNISNLLVTINSSVNFIVYVTFGEKFRRLFFKLFCWRFVAAGSGRESPDGTHDDSLVSNGDNRQFSIRKMALHRQMPIRKSGFSLGNGYRSGRSTRTPHIAATNGIRAPDLVPCVYYPARHSETTELESNFNQL